MLTAETGVNGLSQEAAALGHAPNRVPPRSAVNQQIALAQIVTLMLQSPTHRHLSLSDLDGMILPALRLGQIAVADTQVDQSGNRQPVAAILWASVSPEIDEKISSNLSAPIRLRPNEWRSGNILWITDIIGDLNAGHTLVRNVLNTTLARRTVRVRSLNRDGTPAVLEVSASTVSMVKTRSSVKCNSSPSCHTGTLCASCVTTGCKGHCKRQQA
jgi:cytolysin-activating lysine-acyltransferase